MLAILPSGPYRPGAGAARGGSGTVPQPPGPAAAPPASAGSGVGACAGSTSPDDAESVRPARSRARRCAAAGPGGTPVRQASATRPLSAGSTIPGIRLVADDLDWSRGTGSPVHGTARELLLVLFGRRLPAGRLRGGAEGSPVPPTLVA
ncbi:hypothetical protein ACFWHQ_08270 [Streptomyces sp. NPDC060334]|uniref:hypothetical protein n=1 Tax=Streptomyces sp. NPDC060334 TaxID=3347099 RepID=UPI00366294E5